MNKELTKKELLKSLENELKDIEEDKQLTPEDESYQLAVNARELAYIEIYRLAEQLSDKTQISEEDIDNIFIRIQTKNLKKPMSLEEMRNVVKEYLKPQPPKECEFENGNTYLPTRVCSNCKTQYNLIAGENCDNDPQQPYNFNHCPNCGFLIKRGTI